MFIEVKDPSNRSVFVNTENIVYVRDVCDRDYVVIMFTDGMELRLNHDEMKYLRTILRRIGMEGGPR